MTCPSCKQSRAHRSHRSNFQERLASLIAYYPYRCRDCGARWLAFRYTETEPPGPKPMTVKEIVQTRRKLRWDRTRREILLYGTATLALLAFLYFITIERGG